MGFPWSAVADIAGAGLSFLGGQTQQAQQQQQYGQSSQFANQQLQFQEQLAQHGVAMRVADAKAAGISPLVALGASTFNPSPISLGGFDPINSLSGVGSGISQAGQDISRAAGATMTAEQRESHVAQLSLVKAQLDKVKADTALTQAQTGSVLARQAGNPPMPSISDTGVVQGQGNAPRVPASIEQGLLLGGYSNAVPRVATQSPVTAGVESGRAHPLNRWVVDTSGAVMYEPMAGSAETFGGMFGVENYVRNRLLPQIGVNRHPPPIDVLRKIPGHERDAEVYYDPWSGGYRSR